MGSVVEAVELSWGCFVVVFFYHFGVEDWRFLKKKRGKKESVHWQN